MKTTIQLQVGDLTVPCDLEFEDHRWSSEHRFPEGYFPLTTMLADKRYELYSDGTFAEVDL